ncbi:hypothetical protein, partial [Nostoc sp. UIC 10630]|uniref:hypothetical protein n=1 Tax=Nostoc sp. UIC 10630 TaxID=2100146 RepID=UPI001A9C5776
YLKKSDSKSSKKLTIAATPNYLFVLRLRLIFFSVAASLVVLFKLMLKNLAITATLNQRTLLKTASLNYLFILQLR